MYNIKLESYVPKPNPVTSDRVVAAHYYAAWKKGAAEIHGAFEDLHEYPERTPLMGYYDEENPEVCDWELKWASEHGVNCFIHCWYRRIENTGKPVTEEALRCGHGLHEALFNARYQNCMKFAIMFENSPRWATTDSKDIIDNLMPFWVEKYFSRENYLKIDNKPVLFIYHPIRLVEAFGSIENQRAAFDACREYAKAHGFDGMIFAECNIRPTKEAAEESAARGYDFRFGYDSGFIPEKDYEKGEVIIEGQCNRLKTQLSLDNKRYIPTVSCFRDSTPRTTQHWMDLGYRFDREKKWYLTPEEFRTCIKKMKDICDELPDDAWGKKIMMIDNWNEWDEGHFVSPSVQFGFKYLQAIREELTARDNLPDYRTPHDIGLTGYNKSWSIPDFSEICEKRLKDKE